MGALKRAVIRASQSSMTVHRARRAVLGRRQPLAPGPVRPRVAVSGERTVAVVVTYNRRELLLESLAAVQGQTRPPDAVVVVDNASTDGSGDAVRDAFPDVRLLALTVNTGGAGGFAAGIRAAQELDADAIWLMDDDTVPEPGALAALLAARAASARTPAVVASRVVWTDGRDHPMNTPRPKPFCRGRGAARGRAGRLRADPLGVVRVDPRRRGARPGAGAAGRRVLPVERRLRVHDPPAARAPRGCCAPTASWCTRPRPSAGRPSTRVSGSSSRSATRCGR